MIVSMPKNADMRADFCLEIDFDKETENPGRVFKTMSALIDTFEAIDRDLAVSIDSKIEPILLLEDVEAGSIRVWLANKIRDVEDEGLKSGDYKKVIGQYLVRAKWYIIDFLEGKSKITDKAEIEEMQAGLLELAEDTNVRHLPSYVPIEKTKLLRGVEGITNSISHIFPQF